MAGQAPPYQLEVQAAATWFGEQLYEPNEQRDIFADRLRDLLLARFEGHWYPEEPHRGCAYRALLSTVNCLDPLLLRAVESTGQRGLCESFNKVFSESGEITCWINPGEVKVLRGRSQVVVYSDGTGSDNPYEKLRIKIEPTRLAVKVDPVEHVPNSPASSQGGSASMDGQHNAFGAFRGNSSHCSSQGCSSGGQSPTESPMQSWRASGGGLPAMAPLPPHMGAGGNGSYGAGAFGQGYGQQDSQAFACSQGMDCTSSMAMGSSMGMGGMGMGGFGGANGLQQQQQQQASGMPNSSPMRSYAPYGGGNSYGQTPTVF